LQDITQLTAADLSRSIHARSLSCVAVMEAYLDRIDRFNPSLNAIISLRDRASILDDARTCDRELADGYTRGWMHGFPIAIKDLSEVKGLRCTWGSKLFENVMGQSDDIHVERIRAAGAIIIGKTNTPEMGLGSHTTNSVFGATRNPFDNGRSAGGSSGGAAVAVAARLLPVADGSDMMGSLRNPAAFNNIVGFRPSFGRVPSGKGNEMFLRQLSATGPMARNVQDAALLLATQAGYDMRDPQSLADERLDLLPKADHAGTRIAWLGDFGGYLPFEQGVLEVDRKALDVFAAMGCEIEEIVPEFGMAELWKSWIALRTFNVANGLLPFYDDPEKRRLMNAQALWEIERGLSQTAGDVFQASVIRSDWYKFVCTLFERYDYIVMPSAQVFPFDIDAKWPAEIAGRKMDTYHRWMEVVIGPSMAGLPVAAMPAGFGPNGLPSGIQIVGKPRGDLDLLQFALGYEQARA
jgi:amidase